MLATSCCCEFLSFGLPSSIQHCLLTTLDQTRQRRTLHSSLNQYTKPHRPIILPIPYQIGPVSPPLRTRDYLPCLWPTTHQSFTVPTRRESFTRPTESNNLVMTFNWLMLTQMQTFRCVLGHSRLPSYLPTSPMLPLVLTAAAKPTT